MEIGQRFEWNGKVCEVKDLGSILNRGRIPTATVQFEGDCRRLTFPIRVLLREASPVQEPLWRS